MSMHKKPLTELERAGLKAHGLDIGTPSQLSDAFRQGVAWVLASAEQAEPVAWLVEAWNENYASRSFGYFSSKKLADVAAESSGANRIRVTPLYTRPAPSAVVEALKAAKNVIHQLYDNCIEYRAMPGDALNLIDKALALIPPEVERAKRGG